MPIRRRVITVNTSHQLSLFPGGESLPGSVPPVAERPEPTRGVLFNRPDPRRIFICGERFDDYLVAMGQRDALDIRALLQQQDWRPFAARYRPGGRSPPMHPRR